MIRKMYHTQEEREITLKEPIICIRNDAWLGDAYYYWDSFEDADYWGYKSKKSTGRYEIYVSDINCENVLNTVFNEEHYRFWLASIEKVAKEFMRKTKQKPTLKELNTYFKDKGNWDTVSGILFQDLPASEYYSSISPWQRGGKTLFFAYKKRIQLAVYDKKIILNFALHQTKEC